LLRLNALISVWLSNISNSIWRFEFVFLVKLWVWYNFRKVY